MDLIIASYAFAFILAVSTLCTALWALTRYTNNSPARKEFPCECARCKAKKAHFTENSGRKLTHVIHALSLAMFIFTVIFTVSLYIGRTTITDEFDPYAALNITRTSSTRKIAHAHNHIKKLRKKIVSVEDAKKAFTMLNDDTQLCMYSFGSFDGLRLSIFGMHIPCSFFNIVSVFLGNPIAVSLLFLLGLMSIVLLISSRKLKSMSKEALACTSSNVYRKCTGRNNYSTEDILAVLSASSELEELIYEDLGDDIEYKKLVKILSHKPYTIINDDWIHRSNSLLYFHISRLHEEMSDRILKSSNLITSQIPKIVENYCLYSKSLAHTLKALKTCQCVCQATWSDRPLLQLPHFTEEMADKCVAEYGVFDPIDILKLGKAAGSDMFKALELTPEQVNDILQVENSVFTIVPSVTYDLANPVNCSSEVTLKIKVGIAKIGADTKVSNPDFRFEPFLDDVEIEAHKGIKGDKGWKKHVGNVREYKMDKFSSSKLFSHTPYIMQHGYEKWWFVLGDDESNTLLAVEQGELPQTPDDKPLKIKTKFKVPAEPGIYNFTLYVVCDTYLSRDIRLNVPVTVDTISVDDYD